MDRIPCRKKGDDTKGMQVIHINSWYKYQTFMLLLYELHYLNRNCPPKLFGTDGIISYCGSIYILFYSHVSYDEFKSICKKTVWRHWVLDYVNKYISIRVLDTAVLIVIFSNVKLSHSFKLSYEVSQKIDLILLFFSSCHKKLEHDSELLTIESNSEFFWCRSLLIWGLGFLWSI